MSLPPLHSFKVFECVARLGNISAAADELHVTAGAVSQQLKALQASLGMDLLVKQGRQLVLTDSGKVLQKHVASAIKEIGAGVSALRNATVSPDQVQPLTLSIPGSYGLGWLARRLFTFMDEHRHIKLNVINERSYGQVDWRRADVAVMYGTPPGTGYWWRLLHGIRMTPVCSPQLLRGDRGLRHLDDLSHHRLLHEDDGSQWRRWLTEARCHERDYNDVHFEDFGLVLEAAREGFGVALSDEVVSAKDLDEGRLVQPFTLSVPALHNYYSVCSESSRNRPEVYEFIEWLGSSAR
ncbi:LysR substrate-binding domain-containing protein [Pseudomonas vancouverensis]|uniref:LysR family transcriptional regulator n=1 Tax=Pseudomonas vancouverensis TaxID=95300 RepID=A0A1H2NPU3_PSEVA|nr:LysR substrate-binding domain-containing protein [Pseudomonas vancouverensis]KAB0491268.1 LysR family transcriptional regulator [Pseudomonas vancouverensis]TDB64301.1 LysR family transcriptional regulator [Pseudomonas vancouverensis]SDV07482.1 LysR family transcriptional regulator, glycine cleavage system transcriptional activator [Pseudomonas vancouverensis]